MRSRQEVDEQIARLRAIAANRTFRAITPQGYDNREAINAQIEVLQKRLTNDDVTRLENIRAYDYNAASIARDAAYWLSGDHCYPVDVWDGWYQMNKNPIKMTLGLGQSIEVYTPHGGGIQLSITPTEGGMKVVSVSSRLKITERRSEYTREWTLSRRKDVCKRD